jgi:hypothetical protein
MERFSFLLNSGVCPECGESYDEIMIINNDQSATISYRSHCPKARTKPNRIITKGEAIDILSRLEINHLHQMKVHETKANQVVKAIRFISH